MSRGADGVVFNVLFDHIKQLLLLPSLVPLSPLLLGLPSSFSSWQPSDLQTNSTKTKTRENNSYRFVSNYIQALP